MVWEESTDWTATFSKVRPPTSSSNQHSLYTIKLRRSTSQYDAAPTNNIIHLVLKIKLFLLLLNQSDQLVFVFVKQFS